MSAETKLPTRERVSILPRKGLTLTLEVAVLRRFVVCAGCGVRLTARSEFDYDHVVPLAFGGGHDAENLRPYCRALCHPEKTRRDQRAIAKAKRLSGETCAGPSARPMSKRAQTHWPKRSLPSGRFSRPTGSRP